MATTTFTNNVTLTDAGWFNDVDAVTYDGATTQVLVGGGAGVLAVWTTATGTGAPVRATAPTVTTLTIGSGGLTVTAGNVKVAAGALLYLDGGGNTYIVEGIADNLSLVAGGVTALTAVAAGIIMPDGTVAAPSITFPTGLTDTGIYCPASRTVAIASAGAAQFTVSNGASSTSGIQLNAYTTNGTVTTTGGTGVLSSASDATLKKHDGFIENPLEMLSKLKGRYYYWLSELEAGGAQRQLGFFAQDVNAALGDEAANPPKGDAKWGYYDRSVLAVVVDSINILRSDRDDLLAWKAKAEAAMAKSGITIQ